MKVGQNSEENLGFEFGSFGKDDESAKSNELKKLPNLPKIVKAKSVNIIIKGP